MIMFWILTLLFIKHFIADFVLQFKYQYMNKHRYGHPGGILHALIHTLGTFGIVYLYFSWYVGVFFALIDGFIHYHIDWVRANINFYYDLSPNKAIFWILLGFDQLLHQLTYLGIVVTLFIFC